MIRGKIKQKRHIYCNNKISKIKNNKTKKLSACFESRWSQVPSYILGRGRLMPVSFVLVFVNVPWHSRHKINYNKELWVCKRYLFIHILYLRVQRYHVEFIFTQSLTIECLAIDLAERRSISLTLLHSQFLPRIYFVSGMPCNI